ncbi:hypothetical protein BJ912DRAFT_1147893 [Pholiota molesta]|nr:hypothetical protein BJ912DRAFT_1147893 [Pholiota molesta]
MTLGNHEFDDSDDLLADFLALIQPSATLDGEEVFVVTSYRWREYLGYIDVEFDYRDKIVSYKGAQPSASRNTTAESPKLKAEVTE